MRLSAISAGDSNPAGKNTTMRPILSKNDATERNEEVQVNSPIHGNTKGTGTPVHANTPSRGTPGRPPRPSLKKASIHGSVKRGSIYSGLSPVRDIHEAPITSVAEPDTQSDSKDHSEETPARDPLILQIELEESSMFPKKKL